MRDVLVTALAAAALAFAAVALAVGIDAGSDGESRGQRASAQVEDDSGRAVFARMGCGACHTLAAAGSKGRFGPNLDTRLANHTRATLIASITKPPSVNEYSGMPTDFASRMDARELGQLVDFLLAAR